jgi:catechol 2,3-dioxygenase-like lactoylglutathione lyase family enzyme
MVDTYGLTHIHLVVTDIATSLAFYKGVFGMEELFWEGADLVFLRTPGSNDMVTLNADSTRGDPGDSGGIAHFGFRLIKATDMDRAIEEVEGAGGTLVRRGEHSPGEFFAYVRDPDGYLIEIDAQLS